MIAAPDKPSSPRWRIQALLLVTLASAAVLYFWKVPDHPPGFSIDESSICYNAQTISESGRDEYGNEWPLFFRAFGEYKNPTFIYLLAGLFRLTGPSIVAARALSAGIGLLTGLLLGVLAWQITRRSSTVIIVAVNALLTPWLFESSRLVFEVAIYPAILVLFLITVWRCSQKVVWQWHDILALASTLALLTYSYSIGRLLGPLLAAGLVVFMNRERAGAVIQTWIGYALLLLPLLAFHLRNPGALTGRFQALTYLGSDTTAAAAKQFLLHYAANLNPWRWLVTGEYNIRDHVQNTGALLVGTAGLASLGLFLVIRKYRKHSWWRFVLYSTAASVVPASLTNNAFPQLRLIAFPVLLVVLVIPAVSWLTETARNRNRLLLTAVVILAVGQGLYFQWVYHREAPKLWYVFDARFPRKVLAPALATGIKPVYLLDETGKAGYIHALWYATVLRLEPALFIRASSRNNIPPASLVISTEEDCRDCKLIARALNYIVYATPPYPAILAPNIGPLTRVRAEIIADRAPTAFRAAEKAAFDFRIKNLGVAEWPALGNLQGACAVQVQSRWLTVSGESLPDANAEKRLPFDVEPGDTVGLALEVSAPETPGEYLLEVDLVQTQVGRFSERGSLAWRGKVQILPKD